MKFLVLYKIPASVMDEWKKTSPESRKAAEDKLQLEWQDWTSGRAKLFSDVGAGLGKTKSVTANGTSDARNDLVMYAIAQGDSQDAVAKTFEGHPHLQIPQTSIEVMELYPLPDKTKK